MITPYKHQNKIYEILHNNATYAIFGEAGIGKTIPMLLHISDLLIAGEINNALIIAPVFPQGAWIRDIDKIGGFRASLLKKYLTITTYGKCWRRDEIKNVKWDFICLDEAHNIAYRTSKQTKFIVGSNTEKRHVRGVGYFAKYRYILTGTPISNGKLEQYYPLMDFLEPNFFGTYNDFRSKYLIEKQLPNSYACFVVGYRHKDELLAKVATKSIYISKKDCLDLPDKMDDVIIDCPLVEKKIYKDVEKDFYSEDFDIYVDNVLAKAMKLRQIPNGFIIDEYGDTHYFKTEKLNILMELIESIDSKIVIGYQFKNSGLQIFDKLTKKGIRVMTLNGEQTNKNIWRDFQESKDTKIMLVQYDSGNAGIDLYSASYMIFFDLPQSTTVVSQFKDRIHRIGQKNKCNYYWLITKDTIEENIYKTLKSGNDFNEKALLKLWRDIYGVER